MAQLFWRSNELSEWRTFPQDHFASSRKQQHIASLSLQNRQLISWPRDPEFPSSGQFPAGGEVG